MEKFEQPNPAWLKILWLVPLLAVVAFLLGREFFGGPPQVRLEQELKGIGRLTPISFTAMDRWGLRGLSVEIEQAGQTLPILSETFDSRWGFWRPGPRELLREIRLDSSEHRELKEGQATLRIQVWNKNFFSTQTALTQTLPVRLNPPTIQVLSGLVYVNQAGCEMVLYRVSASAVSSGVRVGSYFFPGYPVPGGQQGERLALFAFPYDAPSDAAAVITAADEIGNEAFASFPYRLMPKQFRHRDIELTDPFLQATVPAIVARTPDLPDQGDLLKNFLLVNGSLRERNRKRIAEISRQTVPEFLWEGAFLQLSNTAVESQFADYRSYVYQGKKVDEQVHLGFDLASVQHAPVMAANSGRVVFAEYLGIFGNTLILDHGFGLQSLYAHLNSFQVKTGDKVKKEQVVGETDSTGLAGGDHLHFTMLLAGVEVNPIEWWDARWIEQHILAKLAAPKASEESSQTVRSPLDVIPR
ncbi:MAG: M23 family metallopeptidase [Acidobacteria bacterium]|nr:M23 family metallopeptidase [Acidobacteriota bacterium]